MLTITPKFASAIYDLYIKKNGKVRLTGDRMKMLQLCFPFLLRDFLKPEVEEVDLAISKAKKGSPLHGRPSLEDPSDAIIELLIKANDWNLMSRQKDLPVDKLPELEQLGIDLLNALKQVLPERTGTTWRHSELYNEFKGWCFEKAHAVLHIPRNLLLFGYLEVTSAQGPEHAHIELMKNIGDLTNNKDVFWCLMKFHAREMFVRDVHRQIQSIVSSESDNVRFQAQATESWETYFENEIKTKKRNENLPCELGIRYPILYAAQNRSKLHISIKVQKSNFCDNCFHCNNHFSLVTIIFCCHKNQIRLFLVCLRIF